jgi:hypothetical protein
LDVIEELDAGRLAKISDVAPRRSSPKSEILTCKVRKDDPFFTAPVRIPRALMKWASCAVAASWSPTQLLELRSIDR